MNYATVDDGMLVITVGKGDPSHFNMHEGESLKRHFKYHGVRDITCSSSVDWPEDGGLPEDADVRGLISYGLSWQRETALSFNDLPGKDSKQKTLLLLETLESGINIMGNDFPDALREHIPKMHRTLQQGLMRDVVVPTIEAFADLFDNDRYDTRNEATCEAASKLKEVLETHGFPCI